MEMLQKIRTHKTLVVSSLGILLVVLLGTGLFFAPKKETPNDVPNIASQERFDLFVDSPEDVINCIKEAIGEENYAEIIKDKPRRPTQEEIKATDNCVKEFGNSDTPQGIAEQKAPPSKPSITQAPPESAKPAEQADPRYTPPKSYAKIVRQTEPLILTGDERRVIENVHWIQASDVVLKGNAELVIRNAFFDIQKEYSDQYKFEAYENSRVVAENIELRNSCTGGFGWNFFDNSSFVANGVQQKDCNIWMLVAQSASATVSNWDWFGGTTCDHASTVIENSKDLEVELCNAEGVDMDIELPAEIPGEYEFSGRTVPGMKNSIMLTNVTIDGWGVGAHYDSDITVRNGDAVTISFGLASTHSGKTVVMENLNKQRYEDARWELGEGSIRLVNTNIFGWETGVWGKDNTLIIRNSNFTGPTLNGGNSKVIVEDSTFADASAYEFVEVEIKNSVITKSITARDNGKIIIRNSELAGVQQGDNFYPVRVTATGNGIVELIGTPPGSAILIEEDNGRIIQR